MPTHKQGTVNAVITTRAPGSAATNDLKSQYATSPLHSGDLTPDSIREQFQQSVLDGVTNDGGHTFGEFNKDYAENGAPDYSEVPTGGGGAPASAFVPNPSSPGEGSVDPTDQPAAPDGFGTTPSATPGAGVGSQLSPKAASAAVSAQTLGDYGFGKGSS